MGKGIKGADGAVLVIHYSTFADSASTGLMGACADGHDIHESQTLQLQVVKTNVSSQIRVRSADPFMKQLGHFDVAIMVHSCSSPDFSSASVGLLPAGDSSGHARVRLFDPPKLQNISQVGDAVMSWTRSKVNATYLPRFLNGFPQHLELPAGNLIADMSRAGAIEGSPYESPFHVIHADDGSAEKLEILERLTDVGFAMAQFLDDTRSAWLLKAEALSHCLALHLKSPQPVFAVRCSCRSSRFNLDTLGRALLFV